MSGSQLMVVSGSLPPTGSFDCRRTKSIIAFCRNQNFRLLQNDLQQNVLLFCVLVVSWRLKHSGNGNNRKKQYFKHKNKKMNQIQRCKILALRKAKNMVEFG